MADLKDVLADRARDCRDLTVRAQQLRYDADTGMFEVQTGVWLSFRAPSS